MFLLDLDCARLSLELTFLHSGISVHILYFLAFSSSGLSFGL